jgi:hypothetical protein
MIQSGLVYSHVIHFWPSYNVWGILMDASPVPSNCLFGGVGSQHISGGRDKIKEEKKYNPRGDPVFSSLPAHNRMDIMSRRIEKKRRERENGTIAAGDIL